MPSGIPQDAILSTKNTPRQPRLIFFGNEQLATGLPAQDAPILASLLAAGYEIAAVVTHRARAVSRKNTVPAIETIASAHGIPVLTPGKPGDILDELKSFGAVAGVLAAYGRIVPQSIIDIFAKGIINVHPSLLPALRGPTPIEGAILSGAEETGVSLMSLVRAMDAGPVYAQARISLDKNETKAQLAETLQELGRDILLKTLPRILDGSARPKEQAEDAATYTSLISRDDGRLSWQKPAIRLHREIRAYGGWPKSSFELGGTTIAVIAAEIVRATELPEDHALHASRHEPGDMIRTKHELFVRCGEDYLRLLRLQPAGKLSMPARAFLAGYGRLLP